jgi:hypothetical protein
MSFFSRMGINLLAGQTKSEGLVAITAREFMFGYKNPLVTIGNTFMPSWIKFDKLGLIDRVSVTRDNRASTPAVSLVSVTEPLTVCTYHSRGWSRWSVQITAGTPTILP